MWKGQNSVAQVYRMTLAGTIYCLRMEQNYRILDISYDMGMEEAPNKTD